MHHRFARLSWMMLCVLSFVSGNGVFAQGTIKRLFGTSTYAGGSVFVMDPDGARFTTLKVFSPDGSRPFTNLTDGGDGFLYGMTWEGGAGVVGVIFKVRTDGSDFSLIHEFNGSDGAQPLAGLLRHSNGFFYGTTIFGGTDNNGVLFRINSTGSNFSVLHNFEYTTGNRPEGNLIEATNGKLYGMTLTGGASGTGVAFSIEADGSNYQVLHNMNATDGQLSYGPLVQSSNGDLYGMAYDGGANDFGVIFRMSTDGSSFSRIHDFNETDGAYPSGGLIEAPDGFMYGMTMVGGSDGNGTIFKIKNDGSDFESLHSFVMPDGQRPRGNLTMKSGVLYGVVGGIQNGPLSFYGGIFKIDTDGSDFAILEQFDYNLGSYPIGTLTLHSNGKLYGFTSGSAKTNGGTVFSYTVESDTYDDLFTFLNPSGKYPQGELVQAADGFFYGMTIEGGAYQNGVVYGLQHDGNTSFVVHDFQTQDGIYPNGALTLNSSGDFFGMTSYGGQSGKGTIFAIRQTTGFEKLYDLDFTRGGNPTGTLVRDGTGYLYGLTGAGGTNGFGTIFKCKEDGSSFTKLHDFNETNGSYPKGSLILATDGKLYGMTYLGGVNNVGVIFKISTDGTSFTKIYDFSVSNGSNPIGDLLQGSDGDLYGAAPAGNVDGVIFKIKTNGTNYQILRNGEVPIGTLIQGPSGDLFGVTQSGGNSNLGTIYKIKPDGSGYQKLHDMSLTNGIPMTKLLLADVPKLDQFITFDPLATKQVTDGPFSLTASASSGLAVEFTSLNPAVATISGNTVTITGGGTALIRASQPGNTYYNPASPVTRTLVVEKMAQVITFNALPPSTFGAGTFNLSATSSSGLAVTYTSSDPAIASISGNTVTIVGAGSTTITASQIGSSFYAPAIDVGRVLTVLKASQTLTFDPIPARTIGDAPFPVTAVATSGLAVQFGSASNKVVLAGNQVTLSAAGLAQITADQPGDANYNPAAQKSQSFCINPVKPAITLNSSGILVSSASAGNQWYFNGSIITGATAATYPPTQIGSYTVVTSVDGCASVPSNPEVLSVITGDIHSGGYGNDINVYPNPASDELIIGLENVETGEPVQIAIHDITGKSVAASSGTGGQVVVVDVRNYSEGIYFVRVIQRHRSFARPFLKH